MKVQSVNYCFQTRVTEGGHLAWQTKGERSPLLCSIYRYICFAAPYIVILALQHHILLCGTISFSFCSVEMYLLAFALLHYIYLSLLCGKIYIYIFFCIEAPYLFVSIWWQQFFFAFDHWFVPPFLVTFVCCRYILLPLVVAVCLTFFLLAQ